MDKMIKIILDTMYDILELDPEEMMELLDDDLVALHLIDSLSAVILLNQIERKLGISVDLQKTNPEDITSIRRLAAVLEAEIG